MPISKFPSVKTSRKSNKTSVRNRSKDWNKSWREYKAKKENQSETIDVYIPPSMLSFWEY